MSWLGDTWEGIKSIYTAPITAAQSMGNMVEGVWNDFTGKTAAEKAAAQANRNTQTQLAWERERALNAHQWEIKDLQAAGLNPILSAGGSGAVTSGISPQQSDFSGITSGTGAALNLLTGIVPMLANVRNTAADTAVKKQQAKNLIADTGIKELQQIYQQYENGIISKNKMIKDIEYAIYKKWGENKYISDIDRNYGKPLSLALRAEQNIKNSLTSAMKKLKEKLKKLR